MNKKRTLVRVLTCGLAVLLLNMGSSQTAFADLTAVGPYKVPAGKTNNDNHEGAEILVFRTARHPNPKFGLLFLQQKGAFRYDAFLCDDAERLPAQLALRCSKIVATQGISLQETLTIGRLNGSFCGGLRAQHNPRGQPTKIYGTTECPSGQRCVCYEIAHACWSPQTKKYNAVCPNNIGVATTLEEADDVAYAPPGKGAGSGGSH